MCFFQQRQESAASDDVFVMSATNTASTSTSKVRVTSGADVVTTDDYTIVDYVEDTNAPKVTLSTSTPRFAAGNDAAALQDLDQLLDTGSTDSSEAGSTRSKKSQEF